MRPTQQVSTVTYLTGGGAPTAVLDRRAEFDGGVSSDPISAGALCYPKVGRHLSFDGRLLHAAPTELAAPETQTAGTGEGTGGGAGGGRGAAAGEGEERVTFLVNVWLQHRPNGIRPFPEPMARQLSDAPVAGSLGEVLGLRIKPGAAPGRSVGEPLPLPLFPAVAEGAPAGAGVGRAAPNALVFPFSRVGAAHAVTLELPPWASLAEAARLGACLLHLGGGNAPMRAWVAEEKEEGEEAAQATGPQPRKKAKS